ncbi:MAG: DUF4276 family protein [Gluconacetobacter diazotrophicus]|nr:DUF4276 family protein [Gluconacetobacter diazotrophicus]
MRYIAWAAFYEGPSDRAYFDVLVPRVLDDILSSKVTRPVEVPTMPAVYIGKDDSHVEAVAAQICEERDAFHLLIIHADTDGRAAEKDIAHRREAYVEAAHRRCQWPNDRTVLLSPRHETEAWALADGEAVCRALGYHGEPHELGLPPRAVDAERIVEPKERLRDIARSVSWRAYRNGTATLLPLIAQEQAIERLRGCPSFQDFESSLTRCLASLGFL